MSVDHTEHYSLPKPDFDTIPWADAMHDMADIIDAVLFALSGITAIRGVWTNATVYAVGDRVVDTDTDALWQCLVGHTSSSTSNFATDRAAHPSYWLISSGSQLTARGAWAQSTVYQIGDVAYQTSENLVGIAKALHTSTASGTMRTDAASWAFIADLSASTAAAAASASASAVSASASAASAVASGAYVASVFPAGLLWGLGLSNNGGAPNTKIDIAVGSGADDTNAVVLKSTGVLTVDFAVNGANGLDTGAVATNGLYAIYLIGKADGTKAGLAAGIGSVTMPSGYIYKRRLGYVRTDGAAHLRPFKQFGDRFLLTTPISEYTSAALGTARVLVPLIVPPSLLALLRVSSYHTTNPGALVIVQPVSETDAAPASLATPESSLGSEVVSRGVSAELEVLTDASSQIAIRASVANTSIGIATRGWLDLRDRV